MGQRADVQAAVSGQVNALMSAKSALDTTVASIPASCPKLISDLQAASSAIANVLPALQNDLEVATEINSLAT